MRNPLSDKIVSIPPSGIRKFFDIVNEMEGAISLGVGEPDFDTPWHIREEGIYSLEKGRTFYTSNAGLKQSSCIPVILVIPCLLSPLTSLLSKSIKCLPLKMCVNIRTSR